jgi:hypothetical protein
MGFENLFLSENGYPNVSNIKARLRVKTPNAWELMDTANQAADYIALLESEAEQLRMSWANSKLDADRYRGYVAAITNGSIDKFLSVMESVIGDYSAQESATKENWDAAFDSAIAAIKEKSQ